MPFASFPSQRAAGAVARPGLGAWAALALCMGLAGCGQSRLPAEKAAYAGDWSAPGAQLRITPGGDVKYREKTPSGELRLDGVVKSFDASGFVAGPASASARFEIQSAPERLGAKWRMRVNGREFWREPGAPGIKERAGSDAKQKLPS